MKHFGSLVTVINNLAILQPTMDISKLYLCIIHGDLTNLLEFAHKITLHLFFWHEQNGNPLLPSKITVPSLQIRAFF